MANTPNLNLPYIAAAQAQKHVTHNEALRALDAVVQLAVLDRDLTTPPINPDEGDRYIIAAPANNQWAGFENQIAAWQDGAWAFYPPQQGWLAWVGDEAQLYGWDGNAWIMASGAVNPAPLVGINTTADNINRLSLSSPASLFNHEGSDHRIKVNKNAITDTAALLFQTSFSGRAEFGLTGDDDWHVKTSADGNIWRDSLIADAASGAVRFPAGVEHTISRKPLTSLIMTPGGAGENSIWRFDQNRSAIPRQAIIASASGDILTLTTAVADQFFNNTQMENVSYVRIWNVSKSPEQSAWVKRVNDLGTNTQLQVIDGNDLIGWSSGETVQLGEPIAQLPTKVVAVDISPMMQTMLGAVFPQAGLLVKMGISLNNVVGNIGVTPTGAGGSFNNLYSHSDGSIQTSQITIPCTQASPISNSNLIFIREVDGGVDSLQVGLVSVFGVWV